jgi:FixJ family two-component response regulator
MWCPEMGIPPATSLYSSLSECAPAADGARGRPHTISLSRRDLREPSQPTAGSARPRLLWIDDEVAPDDAAVRLIALEGFRVDCASSGALGLALARTHTYDGILLDLKLDDMPGLDVLRRLEAEGITTPVLVLTGYPDIRPAVDAMRWGAWDFQPKTILLDDEWKGVVRRLVDDGSAGRASSDARNTPDLGRERCSQDSEIAQELIERLDALARAGSGVRLDQLTGPLIRALLNPDLSSWHFLACAKAFRQVVMAAPTVPLKELAAGARDVLVDVECRMRQSVDPLLRMAMELLEAPAVGSWRRSEEEVAKTIRLNASRLGVLLQRGTGSDFRAWRRTPAMRLAVGEIGDTDEHIDQIAYRAGYEYPSQLSREFEEALGLSPRQFRRLANACRGG